MSLQRITPIQRPTGFVFQVELEDGRVFEATARELDSLGKFRIAVLEKTGAPFDDWEFESRSTRWANNEFRQQIMRLILTSTRDLAHATNS